MANGKSTADAGPAETNNGRSYIVVPMPAFLRERFIQEAKQADKPTGPYVRDLLAEKLGIELPKEAVTRRTKYSSPEEAKAAQKVRSKERNELIKALLAEHKARLTGGAGSDTEQPAEAATA